MPLRMRVGARARHGADPGEQQQEEQKQRPGRGHDLPASDLPVVALVRALAFNGIDHDLPHDVAPHQIRSAASPVQTPATISAMPSHCSD